MGYHYNTYIMEDTANKHIEFFEGILNRHREMENLVAMQSEHLTMRTDTGKLSELAQKMMEQHRELEEMLLQYTTSIIQIEESIRIFENKNADNSEEQIAKMMQQCQMLEKTVQMRQLEQQSTLRSMEMAKEMRMHRYMLELQCQHIEEQQYAQPDSAGKKCPICGAMVSEGVAFCGECGGRIA